MTDAGLSEGLSIGERLADSVNRLNSTAETLTTVLQLVNENQVRLEGLEHTAGVNADRISKSSTKVEMLQEVNRLETRSRRERFRMKGLVFSATIVCLTLIVGTLVTLQEYKVYRHDANITYSQVAEQICEQRNVTWTAMQNFIQTQKALTVKDPSIDPPDKVKMIGSYDELLKSFPTVDCIKLANTLADARNDAKDNTHSPSLASR